MFAFERLVIFYLAFFAIAAPFAKVERRRRTRTMLTAALLASAIFLAARTLPIDVRLWLPFSYIAIGYWVPVPLVPAAGGGAFERWLARTDETARRAMFVLPRWARYVAELGYLACFPLVPAAFAVVWVAGVQADVVRFWMAVLVAGFACYGTLPWLVSRPPRILFGKDDHSPIARANVAVLGRVSHRLNTFPSGHVAVSVAAAVSAGRVWPAAGAVLGVIAAAVAIGAATGRHHFAADVLLGATLGIAAASA